MRLYERLQENKVYDEFDMREARTVSFWMGTFLGGFGAFVLCLLVGLYVNT